MADAQHLPQRRCQAGDRHSISTRPGTTSPVLAFGRLHQTLTIQTKLQVRKRKLGMSVLKLGLGRLLTLAEAGSDAKDIGEGLWVSFDAARQRAGVGHVGEQLNLNELRDDVAQLFALAGSRTLPTIVLVDDAQFADPTTVALVSSLLETRPATKKLMEKLKLNRPGPVFVVMTTWDHSIAEAPVADLVRTLDAQCLAGPEALDAEASGRLVDGLAVAAGLDEATMVRLRDAVRPAIGSSGANPHALTRLVARTALGTAVGADVEALMNLDGDLAAGLGDDTAHRWSRLPPRMKDAMVIMGRIGPKLARGTVEALVGVEGLADLEQARRLGVLADVNGLVVPDPSFSSQLNEYPKALGAVDRFAREALIAALRGILCLPSGNCPSEAFDTALNVTLAQLARLGQGAECPTSSDVLAGIMGRAADRPVSSENEAVLVGAPKNDLVARWAAALIPIGQRRRNDALREMAAAGLRLASARPNCALSLAIALRAEATNNSRRNWQFDILRSQIRTSVDAAERVLDEGGAEDRAAALQAMCEVHCVQSPDRWRRLARRVGPDDLPQVLRAVTDMTSTRPELAALLVDYGTEEEQAAAVGLLIDILAAEESPGEGTDSDSDSGSGRRQAAAIALLAAHESVMEDLRPVVVEITSGPATEDQSVAVAFGRLPWLEAWPVALEIMRSWSGAPSVLVGYRPPSAYRDAALAIMLEEADGDLRLARRALSLTTPGTEHRSAGLAALLRLAQHDDEAAVTALAMRECAAYWPEFERRLIAVAREDALVALRLAHNPRLGHKSAVVEALEMHAPEHLGALAQLAQRAREPEERALLTELLAGHGPIRTWSYRLKSHDVAAVCQLLDDYGIERLSSCVRLRGQSPTGPGRWAALIFGELAASVRPELAPAAVTLLLSHLDAATGGYPVRIARLVARLAVARGDLRRCAAVLLDALSEQPHRAASESLLVYCRPVLSAQEHARAFDCCALFASEHAGAALTLLEQGDDVPHSCERNSQAWWKSARAAADTDAEVAFRLALLRPADAPALLNPHAPVDPRSMRLLASLDPESAVAAARSAKAIPASILVAAVMASSADAVSAIETRWPASPESDVLLLLSAAQSGPEEVEKRAAEVSGSLAPFVAALLAEISADTRASAAIGHLFLTATPLASALRRSALFRPDLLLQLVTTAWPAGIKAGMQSKNVRSVEPLRTALLGECIRSGATDERLLVAAVAAAETDNERGLVRDLLVERLPELSDEVAGVLHADESVAPAARRALAIRSARVPRMPLPTIIQYPPGCSLASALTFEQASGTDRIRTLTALASWTSASADAAARYVLYYRTFKKPPKWALSGLRVLSALHIRSREDVGAALALGGVDRLAGLEALAGLVSTRPAAAAMLLRQWQTLPPKLREGAYNQVITVALADVHTAAIALVVLEARHAAVSQLLQAHVSRKAALVDALVAVRPSLVQQRTFDFHQPGIQAALYARMKELAGTDPWAATHSVLALAASERPEALRQLMAAEDLVPEVLSLAKHDVDVLELLLAYGPSDGALPGLQKLIEELASEGTAPQLARIAIAGPPSLRERARTRLRGLAVTSQSAALEQLRVDWSPEAAESQRFLDLGETALLLDIASAHHAEPTCRRIERSSGHLVNLALRGLVPRGRAGPAHRELLRRPGSPRAVVAALCLFPDDPHPADRARVLRALAAADAVSLVDQLVRNPVALDGFVRSLEGAPKARFASILAAAGLRPTELVAVLAGCAVTKRGDEGAEALLPGLRAHARRDVRAASRLATMAQSLGDAELAASALWRPLVSDPALVLVWTRAAALFPREQPGLRGGRTLPPKAAALLWNAAEADASLLARVALLMRAGVLRFTRRDETRLRSMLRRSGAKHPGCCRERLAWREAGRVEMSAAVTQAAQDVEMARLLAGSASRGPMPIVDVVHVVTGLAGGGGPSDVVLVSDLVRACYEARAAVPEVAVAFLRGAATGSIPAMVVLAKIAATDDEVLDLADIAATLRPDTLSVLARALTTMDPRVCELLAPLGSRQRLALRDVLIARAGEGDARAAARLGELLVGERTSAGLSKVAKTLRRFPADPHCQQVAESVRRVLDGGRSQPTGALPTVDQVTVHARLDAAIAAYGHPDFHALAEATLQRLALRAPTLVVNQVLAARLPTRHLRRIARVVQPEPATVHHLRRWDGSTRAAILFTWLAFYHRPNLLEEARARLRDVLDTKAEFAVCALSWVAVTPIQILEAEAWLRDLPQDAQARALEELNVLALERPARPTTPGAAIDEFRRQRRNWWLRSQVRRILLPHVLEHPHAAAALAHLAVDDGERREARIYLELHGDSDDVFVISGLAVVAPDAIGQEKRRVLVDYVRSGPAQAHEAWLDAALGALSCGLGEEIFDAATTHLCLDWTLATRLADGVPARSGEVLAAVAADAPVTVLRAVAETVHGVGGTPPPTLMSAVRSATLSLAFGAGERSELWTQALAHVGDEPQLAPWLAQLCARRHERQALRAVLHGISTGGTPSSALVPELTAALAILADGPAALADASEAVRRCGQRWPAELAERLVDEVDPESLALILDTRSGRLLDALVDIAETDSRRASHVAEALADVDGRRAAAARHALLEVSSNDSEAAADLARLVGESGDRAERMGARAVLDRGLSRGIISPVNHALLGSQLDLHEADPGSLADDVTSARSIGLLVAHATDDASRLHAMAALYGTDEPENRHAALEALVAELPDPAETAAALPLAGSLTWEVEDTILRLPPVLPGRTLALLGHVAVRRLTGMGGNAGYGSPRQKRMLRQRAVEDVDIAAALATFVGDDRSVIEAAEVASSWADRGNVELARRLVELAEIRALPEGPVRRALVLLEGYSGIDAGLLVPLASTTVDAGVRASAWKEILGRGVPDAAWFGLMGAGTQDEINGIKKVLTQRGAQSPESAMAMAVCSVETIRRVGATFLQNLHIEQVSPWQATVLLRRASGLGLPDVDVLAEVAARLAAEPQAAAFVLMNACGRLPVAVTDLLAQSCLADDSAWVVAAAADAPGHRDAAVSTLLERVEDLSALRRVAMLADEPTWRRIVPIARRRMIEAPEIAVRLLADSEDASQTLINALKEHQRLDRVRTGVLLSARGEGGIAAAARIPGRVGTSLVSAARYFGRR